MSSVLCDLPPELIEMIFRYLSGLEIYYSFHNLNRRFAALIENYNYLSLDFQSESKDVFDYYTIKLIKPFSISALSLSDGDETYGQIDLFFSMFKLCEFVNLRSICFESIYPSTLVWFISEMDKLSNLLIVRIDSLNHHVIYQLQNLVHLLI